MLEWALDALKMNLDDGMLPFKGDETNIAGGILPRKVMYNGSGMAKGCKCRPWESGVNIEAAIRYWEKK